MNVGLHGYGYWGKIINTKLKNCIINPINTSNLDWIFIATPPQYHYEYARKYLIDNVNVFCEKPMTDTYEKALELIELTKETSARLYINNLFLLRTEIKHNTYIPKYSIKFKWYKNGPVKDSIFNDLLYHDLYLLINFLGFNQISNIKIIKNDSINLQLKFEYNKLIIDIDYNRAYVGNKYKSILLDDHLIDLSNPKNDPLQESIDACFNNQIDYSSNHQISMNTMKLLEYFI